MKKTCFILISTLATCFSCTDEHRKPFAALDRAIELQQVYDLRHRQRQDSLRDIYFQQETDSARWRAAFELEKLFFYHNVDSCYRYCQKMITLSGNDAERLATSKACYANILFKTDSLTTARAILNEVDTTRLDANGWAIYCFAGHHIYGRLAKYEPRLETLRQRLIDHWWTIDSLNVECAYYHNQSLRMEGRHEEALEKLYRCRQQTPNDTAKFNYSLAREYLAAGNLHEAVKHFTISAEYDMKVSAKTYISLYELAMILFRRGEIERADRYMRLTLEDALSSHYKNRYNDIIHSEFEIMNALLKQQEQKKRAYLIGAAAIALLLAVALLSLLLLGLYSSRLQQSRSALSEVSSIKDGFLANYMEKCVDYLNKVDEYRSSLRKTVRHEGADAVLAMLRKPSFAAGEFSDLLSSFDSTFLGIFPDFVDKVNEQMQPEYELTMPREGTLSTELRILALIKMGIVKRQKIAKILNMSVTTVYSYHSNLQKHSLHPDASFDQVIASL